ncbi:MAG: hypothetical protein V1926_04800 [Candidatus Peregrinibacteria bacterium]
MGITLSWDIFIIVFFAIVITYSFIIGKHGAVKIIIAAYIAAVAIQGIGNILMRVTGQSQPILTVIGLTMDSGSLSIAKLALFALAIIFIAVRGGISIQYEKEGGTIVGSLITGAFGFVTAGLLLSILLTFISGHLLLDTTLPQAAEGSPVLQTSKLMQLMILNQDLWFSLPAILLAGVGFLSNKK